MRNYLKFAPLLGLLLALAACGTELDPSRLGLTISPAYVHDGEINQPNTLTLRASGFGLTNEYATFKWSFSGGLAGEQDVKVQNGVASLDVTQAYAKAGVYGLVAAVESGGRAGTASAIISVGGADPEREVALTTCGDWVTRKQGAYGVTIDRWDFSGIPSGAVLDLKFDTVGIPDRIVVEYPEGTVVHDTGWRGDAKHDGGPLYPGGVVGPKTGEVSGVLTKAGQDSFVVTVFGPDPKTLWSYDIRCQASAD